MTNTLTNEQPANDTPARPAGPELAGIAVRRVMKKLEEQRELGREDAIRLLATELEEIESTKTD